MEDVYQDLSKVTRHYGPGVREFGRDDDALRDLILLRVWEYGIVGYVTPADCCW
jgi:hypothetical protein